MAISTEIHNCQSLLSTKGNTGKLHSPAAKLRDDGGRRARNSVRIRVIGAYKETLPSRHSNTDVHLDSENFWLHVQNLYKLGVIFQKYWKVSVYGLFPQKNPSRTVKQAFYNFNRYLIFNYRLWVINK